MERVRQELKSIREALKQALYIPSTMQPVAPSTQYTPQPSQEPGHIAPTEFVPPPMAATVAVPSFAESVPRPVVAAPPRRPAVGRNILAIGRPRIVATGAGIIIYAIVTFILGRAIVDAQASGNSFLLNAVISGQSTNAYFVRWDYFILGLSFFIPCFFGAKFGPLAGLAVAVIGASLGDVLSQFLSAWYWFAGFAALGIISGLAYTRTRGSYAKPGNILLAVAYSFVAMLIWGVFLLVGDFTALTVDFGIFFPTLLTLTLVELVSLVPLVIALIISNAFTKVPAITNR